MKMLFVLLFVISCSHIEKITNAKEYCKQHPLECKEKKSAHDEAVQAGMERNLQWWRNH